MPPTHPGRWAWPGLVLAVGVAGMGAVWVAASVLSGRPCSWLGLVAAVDMALLLRLTGAPGGRTRVIAAVLATLAAIVLSRWLIVATQLGVLLGMPPLASALRLGPALAWELNQLALDRVDWVLLLSSLPLAAILAEQAPAPVAPPVSGRRPAP